MFQEKLGSSWNFDMRNTKISSFTKGDVLKLFFVCDRPHTCCHHLECHVTGVGGSEADTGSGLGPEEPPQQLKICLRWLMAAVSGNHSTPGMSNEQQSAGEVAHFRFSFCRLKPLPGLQCQPKPQNFKICLNSKLKNQYAFLIFLEIDRKGN